MPRLTFVRFAAPLAVLALLGVGLPRASADYSEDQLKADLKLFENAKLSHADKDLLQFIQSRLLADKDRERIAGLIDKLSSKVYKEREVARLEVEKEGPPALPLLRSVLRSNVELEVKQRAERCIKAIEEKSPNVLVMAAARLLRHRRAAGAVPVLMEYVAIAPDEAVEEEVFASVYSLALVGAKLDVLSPAVKSGKLDPHMETALTDKDPTRRAIAALVVARYGDSEQGKAVAKLLTDNIPVVRFRAAQGLAIAKDKSGIPVMVEMLGQGPMNYALQAEDLLSLIAQEKGPTEQLEDAKEARQKCQTAWKEWWDKNNGTLDLSRIEVDTPFGGVAKRASNGALRFFDAVVLLQSKGDFSMFAKTTDVPFSLAGQAFFKTRKELDDFIKMSVKGDQKDENIPKFKVIKIVPAVEYVKGAPENERSFLMASRLAQVHVAYIIVQEGRNNMDQEIGLPLFIRLSGGTAKCIGLGQPGGQ